MLYFPRKVSLSEAIRSCLSLNMTLLNVDLLNMPFFYDLLSGKYVAWTIGKLESNFADSGLVSVWTTGSSEGTGCDVERTFSWCSSGKLLLTSELSNSLLWEKVPDGSPSAARCLVLSVLNRVASLTQADCANDRKPFVCQVRRR